MKLTYKVKTWARALLNKDKADAIPVARIRPPELHPGAVPAETKMAQDTSLVDVYRYANATTAIDAFMGYPLLSNLTQIAEYRMLTEKTAAAMCRKWIKLKSKGDDDKTDRIQIIGDALERFKVRELFKQAATYDGFFGRAQLYIDIGPATDDELQMPMIMDAAKITKGSLRKFKLIDPSTTYPYRYSAADPLADDYYKPTTWFVMSRQVHSSRLLLFVSRPVPDLLKPAYNFGGLSMSQLAKPYVDNWLKTRTSVGKLISNFSTSGIKTNMQATLQGDAEGDDIIDRAELFSAMRDNQGTMLLDMETEEFFQHNTPLTTVDKLQAQSQEHMASVSSTPLSILLGITPTGLNASSEGEIRIFYDYVLGQQEAIFHDNLKKIIDVIQLSECGDIDPDITFEFVSLWQMDDGAKAKIRKDDADAATAYLAMGAISSGEVRQKLASDPESGYNGLEIVTELGDADPAEI